MNNNKFLALVTGCLVSLMACQAQASSSCVLVPELEDAPVISFTLGFNEDDSRFVYVQCILNRALRNMGYRSELLAAPVGREIYDVAEGRADAVAATTVPELWPIKVDNLVRLEDPFVRVTNVVFTREGVPTPSSWQALAQSNLRIVMARHHRSAQAYLANANTLDVEGVDQAIAVFLAGRADALVTFEANEEIRRRLDLQQAGLNPVQELSHSQLYTFINEKYRDVLPAMNSAIQHEIDNFFWNLHE